ncbi:hypothetical protein KIN20_008212 [Parelaphostrongylus tenuis]|uniref:Uncharacterized protein n=1 Tax=Parelaphostrongylus tenuis TaxID=148309 RepID=A0AAD5M6I5_PARTN|nr:hypothetical protein KIN20_008212 [Parelaphostrongylus tenuis]
MDDVCKTTYDWRKVSEYLMSLVNFLSSTPQSKINDMKRIAMTEEQYRKVVQLHYGWYVQAVKALLGAVGKELYMKMDRNNRRAFVACLDSIDNEHDLQLGAQCLVKAFDGRLVPSFPYALYNSYYDFSNVPRRNFNIGNKVLDRSFADRSKAAMFLKLHFGKNAELVKKSSGDLSLRKFKTSSKGLRSFLKSIRRRKKPSIKSYMRLEHINGKGLIRRWRRRRRRLKRNVLSLYTTKEAINDAKQLDRKSEAHHSINMKSMPALISKNTSLVGMLTDLIGSMWRVTRNQTKMGKNTLQSSYSKLQQLQEKVTKAQQEGQFKYRMLDMVLGRDNPFRKKKSFTERFRDLMPERVVDKSVYDLVDAVFKHTTDVNQRFLSPRILPLLPDKYWAKPLLSPDLFPLYKDDTDTSILPLPEVLEKSGLSQKDRVSMLELIMDVSGVNDVIEDTIDLVDIMKRVGLGKDLLAITSKIDEVFKDLTKSLQAFQRRELVKPIPVAISSHPSTGSICDVKTGIDPS